MPRFAQIAGAGGGNGVCVGKILFRAGIAVSVLGALGMATGFVLVVGGLGMVSEAWDDDVRYAGFDLAPNGLVDMGARLLGVGGPVVVFGCAMMLVGGRT